MGRHFLRLADALEGLARVLEAKPKPKKKKNTARNLLLVAAFLHLNSKTGKPEHPVAIVPGDDLFVQPMERPGAGTISRDESGSPYATALQTLAAGKVAEILIAPWEKRWETDGNPCDVCDENALVGWIEMDEPFPSGAMEPTEHPNCRCVLVTRRIGDR